MGQTVVEKIAQAHMAAGPSGRALAAGDYLHIRPRHVMTHDNTAPAMQKFRTIGAARIRDPRQPVFILDHDIQNRSEKNLAKYAAIREFALEQGVDFYPAGSGIGHQVMIEQQYAIPGAFVVAADSHANMYGGVGALGTPVVRSDAAAIWATGSFWWRIPRTVQVLLEGRLPEGSTGKDAILVLCGLYNRGEVLNAVVEFAGSGVATLALDERLTIANMTTEWGALAGWFPVDDSTLGYLRSRRELLAEQGAARIGEAELASWTADPPRADADAVYAGRIRLDLGTVVPHVSGPDSVQRTTPLPQIATRRIAIQKAYLVSCVNSRAEDIEAAARVLAGKKIADGVELYVAAASREVEETATAGGAWKTLLDAGAIALPPGCGPCIGLGAGLLEAGEVGISASNRNFKGRMGSPDARCYLASPAVVAASAIAGRICGPTEFAPISPVREYEELAAPRLNADDVELVEGFPAGVEGRLVFLPQDNLNTDGIYGREHTYRDDTTGPEMGRLAFENYDPELAARLRPGDILVGGWNFGIGSSREQAVTSLQAAGIAAVVASSFPETYLRNAINNGFLCIACPELIERLRELLREEIDRQPRSLIPGDAVTIDFSASSIDFRGKSFRFPPLDRLPQQLVVAGGIVNHVRKSLRLA